MPKSIMVVVRPHSHPLAYWAYILLAGLTIPPNAQVVGFPDRELAVVTIGFLSPTETYFQLLSPCS
jgi:hypothetical protein